MTTSKKVWGTALSLFLMVFSAACSSKPVDAPKPAPAAESAKAEPAKAEPPKPAKLKVMMANVSLSYMTMSLAQQLGYLKEEGIELEFNNGGTGAAQVVQAVMSGEYDLGVTGATGVYAAVSQGRDVKIFSALASEPIIGLTMRNATVEKLAAKGIKPDSPIEVRMQALKGLTFALPPAGSSIDAIFRATLATYGISENDVTLQPISDVNAAVALTREGRVDGFIHGSPSTEVPIAEKWGQSWASWAKGQIPATKGFLYTVIVAKGEWLNKNADVATRLNRALWKATNLIQTKPDEARKALRPVFKDMDEALYNASYDAVYKSFLNGPLVTEQGFKVSHDMWAKSEKKPPAPLTYQQAIEAKYAQSAKQ